MHNKYIPKEFNEFSRNMQWTDELHEQQYVFSCQSDGQDILLYINVSMTSK